MSEITLYSAPLCPFAHRTRLALAEKGVQATEVEIDLHNKPAGFLGISPHGKVPVLSHAGRLVWESAIINEYLDEAFPAKPCCPSEPIQRAYARIWINFADSRLYSTTGKLLHSPDQKVQALGVIQLADDLRFLESRALATRQGDGPYWLGSELSLADLAFHPWFEQVTVLERYRNFKMPADCSRLMRWWKTSRAGMPCDRSRSRRSSTWSGMRFFSEPRGDSRSVPVSFAAIIQTIEYRIAFTGVGRARARAFRRLPHYAPRPTPVPTSMHGGRRRH